MTSPDVPRVDGDAPRSVDVDDDPAPSVRQPNYLIRRGIAVGGVVGTVAIGVVAAALYASRATPVQGQAKQDFSVAAVPGEKGGQDIWGAYEPVPDWPKPLTGIAGHEKWTFGAGQGVFAQSPDRVFILQRGELPAVERPKTVKIAPVGSVLQRSARAPFPPDSLSAMMPEPTIAPRRNAVPMISATPRRARETIRRPPQRRGSLPPCGRSRAAWRAN